jgi:hypothetical protein
MRTLAQEISVNPLLCNAIRDMYVRALALSGRHCTEQHGLRLCASARLLSDVRRRTAVMDVHVAFLTLNICEEQNSMRRWDAVYCVGGFETLCRRPQSACSDQILMQSWNTRQHKHTWNYVKKISTDLTTITTWHIYVTSHTHQKIMCRFWVSDA